MRTHNRSPDLPAPAARLVTPVAAPPARRRRASVLAVALLCTIASGATVTMVVLGSATVAGTDRLETTSPAGAPALAVPERRPVIVPDAAAAPPPRRRPPARSQAVGGRAVPLRPAGGSDAGAVPAPGRPGGRPTAVPTTVDSPAPAPLMTTAAPDQAPDQAPDLGAPEVTASHRGPLTPSGGPVTAPDDPEGWRSEPTFSAPPTPSPPEVPADPTAAPGDAPSAGPDATVSRPR